MKRKISSKKIMDKTDTEVILPTATWQKITPDIAEEMLKRLTINRKLIVTHLSFLVREMKSGHWKINGDAIRFSPKRLLDGQHRLHAIIQSGVAQWMLVVEEIEDEAYESIDVGRGRQAGDVLSSMKYANPFMMAATARFIWFFDNKYSLDVSMRISNNEIVEIIRKYPFIQFICDYISTKIPMRASPITAALTLISRRAGREMTMYFAEKLCIGAELRADDPIKFFRDRWMMESTHRSSRGERVVWIAMLIKTYNAWVAGKKTNQCETWRQAAGEHFPEVTKETKSEVA
jgi:hypothetical protein